MWGCKDTSRISDSRNVRNINSINVYEHQIFLFSTNNSHTIHIDPNVYERHPTFILFWGRCAVFPTDMAPETNLSSTKNGTVTIGACKNSYFDATLPRLLQEIYPERPNLKHSSRMIQKRALDRHKLDVISIILQTIQHNKQHPNHRITLRIQGLEPAAQLSKNPRDGPPW